MQFLLYRWNIYDIIVVFGALITTVWSLTNRQSYNLLQVEKIFQLLIIFRLVQKIDTLETIFQTMLSSAISAYNVIILALLLMTVFSIMCMQLFGLTRFRGEMNENVSFRSKRFPLLISPGSS